MRNILVKSLFEIEDPDWHIKDRSGETDLYAKYVEMHRLSLNSFTRHLKGDWEFRFISGKVKQVNDAFKRTFFGIYDLWKEGDTTILYTDPDTVIIKDIDLWQISNDFMMFNYTDPKSFDEPNSYGRKFDNFFNAGVRFFPAGMRQDIWDRALDMANDWDDSTYHTEQIILNSMLWDQGVQLSDVLRPGLAYQAQWLPNQAPLWYQDLWNGIDINQCFIVHTHSSRDIDVKLDFMKQISAQT